MKFRLQEIRESRRLSQAELARISGVPQPQISMIENEKVPAPQIDTLYQLAEARHCTVDDLIVRKKAAG